MASRAPTLPLSGYSTTSGMISVERISTRTGGVGTVDHLMRACRAAREADSVTLDEHLLAVRRAQGRPAAQDDQPLLVRMVEVVGPGLLARTDLVEAAADQLGAEPPADMRVPDPVALPLPEQVPLVAEQVEDLQAQCGAIGPSAALSASRRDCFFPLRYSAM